MGGFTRIPSIRFDSPDQVDANASATAEIWEDGQSGGNLVRLPDVMREIELDSGESF